MNLLRFRPALTLVFALLSCACASGCRSANGSSDGEGSAATRFRHGVVSADHELASRAGLEILRDRGGNAVDAAVATSFALSIVRPEACGIGGGGFMVIHLRGDPRHGTQSFALNYRETAPASVTADYFQRLRARGLGEGAARGATSAGVPGTVAGLLDALDRYGTLDRATVLAPAIRLAEEGFEADRHYVSVAKQLIDAYRNSPEHQKRFAFVWKRFLREGQLRIGDRITLPEQAAALRLIAQHGAAAFYEGAIADAILQAVRDDGGEWTAHDLRGYRVDHAQPLHFDALGRHVVTMPPPSSGGVAMAQVFGILQRVAVYPPQLKRGHGRVHLQVEAMKHAFADRARFMGDPAFSDIPVARLMSHAYLEQLAKRVNPYQTLSTDAYGTRGPLPATRDDAGTSHLSVVDARGNAVACTETVYTGFGSHVAVEKYGFVLNNTLGAFTTEVGRPNAMHLLQSENNVPGPGRRPLASMTPTIVLDPRTGRVQVVAGASGGPRIISATFQAIDRVLSDGATATEAVTAPRFHHQWQPDVLGLEDPLCVDSELLRALRVRGHTVTRTGRVGNVQLIRWDNAARAWDAASDPRIGGAPAGY